MMDAFTVLTIPRFDDAPAHAAFRDTVSRIVPSEAILLLTPFWPSRELATPWLVHLNEAVATVAESVTQPVMLAELPPALFDQIADNPGRVISESTAGVMDQMFRGTGRLGDKGDLRKAVRSLLNDTAPARIEQRLRDLGMIVEGHFELPSGRHSDKNVRFGDFELVDGGHGTAGFMSAYMARQLYAINPWAVVFWGHATLTWMAEATRAHLQRVRREPRLIPMAGPYEEPVADEADFAALPVGRTVALVCDIAATMNLTRKSYATLGRLGIKPEAIAPFVTLSPSVRPLAIFATRQHTKLIRGIELEAQLWSPQDCPLCRQRIPLTVVDDEARRDPKVFGSLAYQPPRARVLSSAISGGQIGTGAADHERRHLHDTYLRPALTSAQMGALLDDAFTDELAALDFNCIVYHANVTESIVARVRSVFYTRQISEIPARREEDRWVMDRPIPKGTNVLFVDDGANTGKSIQQILHDIKQAKARAVGVLVFEDKMPDWAHAALKKMCRADSDNPRRIELLFVHRSPHAQEGMVEGPCRGCERRTLARLLCAESSARPAYVQAAYAMLLRDPILSVPEHTHPRAPVDVNRGDRAADQLNALLTWIDPGLTNDPRLMNFIMQDFLPDLRHEDSGGLVSALNDLEEHSVECALLWVDTDELGKLEHLIDEMPARRLSAQLNEVASSSSVLRFGRHLEKVIGTLRDHPELIERRYYDITERIIAALMGKKEQQTKWILEAVKALSSAPGSGMSALRRDLEFLGKSLWSSVDTTGTVYAWLWPDGGPLIDPTPEQLQQLSKARWVVDASSDPPYYRDGGKNRPIATEVALTLAWVALAGEELCTTNITRFYIRAGLPLSGRSRRDTFNALCAEVGSDAMAPAFQTMNKQRAEPESRIENHLWAVAQFQGLVIWRDSGRLPWSLLTSKITPRLESISPSTSI